MATPSHAAVAPARPIASVAPAPAPAPAPPASQVPRPAVPAASNPAARPAASAVRPAASAPAASHSGAPAVVPPAQSVHPTTSNNVAAPTVRPTSTSHALSSAVTNANPTQTGTVLNATAGRHTGLSTGPLVIIIIAAVVVSLVSFLALWRCARKRAQSPTDLPPPNSAFFQPYWKRQSLGTREEENVMQQIKGDTPWLPFSGSTPTHSVSPSENSWRKSVGESNSHHEDATVTIPPPSSSGTPSGSSGNHPGSSLARSPLGTEDPIVPQTPSSPSPNPFLSSSPAASSSTSVHVRSTFSPDPSSTTTGDGLLATFPTAVEPLDDPHGEDFFPSSGPRPPTSASRRTPSRQRTLNEGGLNTNASRRQSRHSMSSLASGYSPSYFGDARTSMRGTVPHRTNMAIILPEPLAQNTNLSIDNRTGPSPRLFTTSNSLNRKSRVDMWAESLTRTHSPRPSSASHESIVNYTRDRKRSEESFRSNIDRSRQNHPAHQEPSPDLPYLKPLSATPSVRAETPGSLPGRASSAKERDSASASDH